MADFARLLLKVLVPSLIISWGIKFVAPQFTPPPDNSLALILVFTPVVAIAVWLGLQEWQGRKQG